MSPDQSPPNYRVHVPDEITTGVFADFASIWHTPNSFVLDFLSMSGPSGPDGIPCRLAARVRIPPEQVFEIARTLTQRLELWETETGRKPSQETPFP